MAKYKLPVEKFGVRLARLLNKAGPDGEVLLEPWLIERAVRDILLERKYLLLMVGLREMGMSAPKSRRRTGETDHEYHEAGHAAEQWMRLVLDRPLMTHAKRETHLGHHVLADLVSQGAGVTTTELRRNPTPPPKPDIFPAALRNSFRELAKYIAIRGNGAENAGWARRNIGPLCLHANATASEVIDPLSIWEAILCAPQKSRVRTADELDATVKLMVNAVATAHKQWDALRALNLSPPDWMGKEAWEEEEKFDSLNTNQALQAARFASRARKRAEADGRTQPSLEDFRQAWEEHPVSKRITFDAFAMTRAGRAILAATPVSVGTVESYDSVSDEDISDNDSLDAASESDMFRVLEKLRENEDLPAEDMDLIFAIARGERIEDMLDEDPSLQQRFKNLEEFASYIASLMEELDRLIN